MGFLTKKIGGFPVWLLVAGSIAGYLMLRHRTGSSAVTGSAAVPATSTYSSGADQGLVPQAGSSADTGAATSDLLSAYGSQQDSLLGALLQAQQNVVQLASAQQSSLATSTATAPIDTSAGAGVSSQPGGSNAPQFTFVFPNLPTSSSTAPASKVKTAPVTKTSAATKYFTYKKQVPLKSGQTVHFQTGKGYYAG